MDCCGKLEIILPSISGNDLENIVTFLYSGRILCTDPMATSKILSNLTDLLGMAILVVEFSRVEYEIRKVFG